MIEHQKNERIRDKYLAEHAFIFDPTPPGAGLPPSRHLQMGQDMFLRTDS